jgi:hypothetical protein
MVMKCPSCGAENPDHADYCNLCLSSVGFEDLAFTQAKTEQDEGFPAKYPSSFSEDAPQVPPESLTPLPDVPPVEIGQYGQRSGEQSAPSTQVQSTPLDIGHYGAHSGSEPHQAPPLEKDYTAPKTKRGLKRKKR